MSNNLPYNILIVLGPTASGKTKLAVELAYLLNTEIISADSRQVYKELNIGVGKDYDEYFINNTKINSNLIDIISLREQYHVHQYKKDFEKVFQHISIQGKIPILCGGTGMYIDQVVFPKPYTAIPVNIDLRNEIKSLSIPDLIAMTRSLNNPSFKFEIDTSSHKRLVRAVEILHFLNTNPNFSPEEYVKLNPYTIGINPPLEIRRKKIEERLIHRIERGMIEEVKNLLAMGFTKERLQYLGLEYSFIIDYLYSHQNIQKLINELTIGIQQFAKRQMTYFRKLEKDGLAINWYQKPEDVDLDKVKKILSNPDSAPNF
jgi:tRNA dimethylallyltransferase